jgi:hypothetical protein|tara:strand:+ start:320 stop:520 length:201 start_codon:yes stop_codon:yes gene_type:complete
VPARGNLATKENLLSASNDNTSPVAITSVSSVVGQIKSTIKVTCQQTFCHIYQSITLRISKQKRDK